MSPREDPTAAVDDIFERAAERGRSGNIPYAGLVTPAEAWALQQAGAAIIVDVRTRPEWEYVGRVRDSVLIEWRRYGDTTPNPAFLAQLSGHVDREAALLFLCRSGVRSHHAAVAAAAAGYKRAFNVLEGFEGDADGERQRGHLGGWRKAGLPWVQD